MFNRSRQSNNPSKGAQVHKNDTRTFSPWDVPLVLVLLTRLPLPVLPKSLFERQSKAAWAYPAAGLVVGGLGCIVGWSAMALGLSGTVGAILAVAVLIAATGAMHEDGLADTADGLWGGYTPERRLEIMKDSHIGTYGVLALLVIQLLRISAVATLLAAGSPAGILAAAVFSRAVMPPLMAGLPNARGSGLSHSVGAPPPLAVAAGLGLAFVLSLALLGWTALLPVVCALAATVGLAIIAKAKIGGQTGDILGASQQLSEVAFLLAVAALL